MRDRIYVHLVWTTRDRKPTIDQPVARFLSRYLVAVAHQERAGVHALGIVRTHVHLLLQLHPTTNISKLLQRMKGGSAAVANREGCTEASRPLRWAKGYSITSVSPSALPSAQQYVLEQARHHPRDAITGWEPEAPFAVVAGGDAKSTPENRSPGRSQRQIAEPRLLAAQTRAPWREP